MAKHSANILEWARQGAEARWHQLQAELVSLAETFPHLTGLSKSGTTARGQGVTLRDGGTGVSKGPGHGRAAMAADEGPRRKRSKMTAAQKRAVSMRMKKYWAERRKAAKA